jgi:hypothetical protein
MAAAFDTPRATTFKFVMAGLVPAMTDVLTNRATVEP